MGNEAGIVLGALGFTLVVGTLLNLAGLAGPSVFIPQNPGGPGMVDQSFGEAVGECIFTLFIDCSQSTESGFWTSITNFIGFIFNFLGFFFQLLTLQLPIPVWLNTILIAPLALALVYVGMRFFRGGG